MFPAGFFLNGVWVMLVLFTAGYLVLYLRCRRFRAVPWTIFFGLFLIANFLDFYTTWLVIDRFGIEYEQNQAARALMYPGWRYFALGKLVLWPAVAALALLVMRFHARPAIALFLGLTTMLFVIGINNIVVYIRLLARY